MMHSALLHQIQKAVILLQYPLLVRFLNRLVGLIRSPFFWTTVPRFCLPLTIRLESWSQITPVNSKFDTVLCCSRKGRWIVCQCPLGTVEILHRQLLYGTIQNQITSGISVGLQKLSFLTTKAPFLPASGIPTCHQPRYHGEGIVFEMSSSLLLSQQSHQRILIKTLCEIIK